MRIFRKHSFFLCLGFSIFVLSSSGWVLVHSDGVSCAGWRSSKSWVRKSWWIWLSRKYLRYYHTHAYKYLFCDLKRLQEVVQLCLCWQFMVLLLGLLQDDEQAPNLSPIPEELYNEGSVISICFEPIFFGIFIYQHIAHWSRLNSSKTSGLSTLGISWTKLEWNLF